MSAGPDARAEALTVESSRRAGSTPLPTRLNRVLFSTHRWPWLLLDMALALMLYEIGIRISPYGGYRDLVSPYVALSLVFALAFGAISLGMGSYDRDRRFEYLGIARVAITAAILASIINVAYHYFALYAVVGRLTLVYGAMLSLAGVMLARWAITWAVRQHPYRFAVIGNSRPVSEALARLAAQDHTRMYEAVAWSDAFKQGQQPTARELIDANFAEIVVASDALADDEAVEFALVALRANVPIVNERNFYTRLMERLPIDDVSKRWILDQGLARPQGVVVATKRLFDVVLASVGLVLLSPVMLLIALAIKLTSPGPILFVHARQGRFYEPFRMFKFRTMRHDPEATAKQGFTRIQDDRVTGVGRLLRRIHFDELPQLVNILRGEMSIVGPRPESLEFAERMTAALPLYELRYLVRPGLTGHAQLKQGYAMDTVLDTRTKLSYDLFYLCNYSLRTDIRLMLRTVFFLVRGSR
ncbi:MAG: exopolysaccharide biosynthesis polyprenyl glycosylphosphotransferase [Chloroflexi bacterium]|nr:exopolysaccharide biosynthesis polyprenyl glycosylphosphotransferase [Chloroflexota bacterium]